MNRSNVRTLEEAASALERGTVTSRELVQTCLAHIAAPGGEGSRTFLKEHHEQALAAASAQDSLRAEGASPSRYAGIPISIKDLFDVAGEVTTAGSVVLRDAPAASTDAVAVARLRRAGFVIVGRTNMTEFAFSGLGLNPHYDTPRNPWDRATGRIPGGSSSGAAVSVTDAMACAGLGTDTGGSCRIPAALCGIVGFKPTARRVPLAGAYPLSFTLDSIGSLANSVACCAVIDGVLADEPRLELPAAKLGDLHFGVPRSYVLEAMDSHVAACFERALRTLAKAGARLSDISLDQLNELPDINRKGGLATSEAYAQHRRLIATDASKYDPRVANRILRGREQDAADYIELHQRRRDLIERTAPSISAFDALLMPTVPVVAPALSEFASDENYMRLNALMLRNPSIVNFLDGCAISLPCHEPGTAPVGLMLFGSANTDRRLLACAAAVESSLDEPSR